MAPKQPSSEIIFGVDPGTRVTGYGIIDGDGKVIDCGCIRPPASKPLVERYRLLHESLQSLCEKFRPTAVSVETQYVHKNIQSAIKLGMARGVVIVAMGQTPIFEYAPSKAKLAVTGRGNASKAQVTGMVEAITGLKNLPEDAADALALAFCHRHMQNVNYDCLSKRSSSR